ISNLPCFEEPQCRARLIEFRSHLVDMYSNRALWQRTDMLVCIPVKFKGIVWEIGNLIRKWAHQVLPEQLILRFLRKPYDTELWTKFNAFHRHLKSCKRSDKSVPDDIA